MGERQNETYTRWTSRRALATCALLTLPLGACDGVLHPVIHAAVHSTLNEQFQRAGLRQPAPISEAVEYSVSVTTTAHAPTSNRRPRA